jgi:hypothetical protein
MAIITNTFYERPFVRGNIFMMVWEEIIDFSTNFENTQQLQS